MCCFSGQVDHVSSTKIFARAIGAGRQALVYAMEFGARADVAMVLPLPVPPGSPEDALRFTSLESYPEFFDHLANAVPPPMRPPAMGYGAPGRADLPVSRVGAFDASFVPTIGDFDRLDVSFRLPPAVWASLPSYRDFGFAVFRLHKGRSKVHPMAFSFPSRVPDLLFFPTVHVHDGVVHEKAAFDHALYAQGSSPTIAAAFRRGGDAEAYVRLEDTGELVAPQTIFGQELSGVLPHGDIYI
jgi:hypothetical protein